MYLMDARYVSDGGSFFYQIGNLNYTIATIKAFGTSIRSQLDYKRNSSLQKEN